MQAAYSFITFSFDRISNIIFCFLKMFINILIVDLSKLKCNPYCLMQHKLYSNTGKIYRLGDGRGSWGGGGELMNYLLVSIENEMHFDAATEKEKVTDREKRERGVIAAREE